MNLLGDMLGCMIWSCFFIHTGLDATRLGVCIVQPYTILCWRFTVSVPKGQATRTDNQYFTQMCAYKGQTKNIAGLVVAIMIYHMTNKMVLLFWSPSACNFGKFSTFSQCPTSWYYMNWWKQLVCSNSLWSRVWW